MDIHYCVESVNFKLLVNTVTSDSCIGLAIGMNTCTCRQDIYNVHTYLVFACYSMWKIMVVYNVHNYNNNYCYLV